MSFAQAWNYVPHSDLKNVFYNDTTEKVRFIQLEENEVRINALSLF